jgi:hypothetical protein
MIPERVAAVGLLQLRFDALVDAERERPGEHRQSEVREDGDEGALGEDN